MNEGFSHIIRMLTDYPYRSFTRRGLRGVSATTQPPYEKMALITVPITTQWAWAGLGQTSNRNRTAAINGAHSRAMAKAVRVLVIETI